MHWIRNFPAYALLYLNRHDLEDLAAELAQCPRSMPRLMLLKEHVDAAIDRVNLETASE